MTQQASLVNVAATLINPVAKPYQTYASAFAAITGVQGWWDLTDSSGLITLNSGKISAAAPLASTGSSNLAQATSGTRPTYDTTGLVGAGFSAGQVLDFAGTHPAGDHTVAVILSLSALPGAVMNILGSNSAGTPTRHELFIDSSNILHYAVNSSNAQIQLTTAHVGVPLLVVADYIQSTGACRLRLCGLPQTLLSGAGASSLVGDFYVGAAADPPVNSFSGKIFDVGLFNVATIIGQAAETTIKNYAHEIRGVVMLG